MKKLILSLTLISSIACMAMWMAELKYQDELEKSDEDLEVSGNASDIANSAFQKEHRLKDMSKNEKTEALNHLKDLYPSRDKIERNPAEIQTEESYEFDANDTPISEEAEDDFKNTVDLSSESFDQNNETDY